MKALWTLIAIAAALPALAARAQPEPAPLTSRAAEARLAALFKLVDGDGDGRLSRQEVYRARRLHRPAAVDEGMPGLDPRIWGHFDADRDGFVSRAEAFARARAMFRNADANRDGALTHAEREEAQEKAFFGACADGSVACRAERRPAERDGAEFARARPGLEPFGRSVQALFRSNSGIIEPSYEIIRNAAGWRRLWNQIAASRGPAPTFPHVDFRRHSVLLAAMGQRGTGGYSIEIASVRPEGSALVATVVRTSPGKRCGTLQAVTQPADLVKIPATSKPVRWRFQDRVTHCP